MNWVPPQSTSQQAGHHLNEDAEKKLLGSLMTFPKEVPAVLNEARLEPEHFYYETHGLIFSVIVALYEEGHAADVIAVEDALRRAGNPIMQQRPEYLMNMVLEGSISYGSILKHAELIMEAAKWRHLYRAGQMIQTAAAAEDEKELNKAEAELSRDIIRKGDTADPELIRVRLRERLEAEVTENYQWPIRGLNERTGGFAPGEFAVLVGWTSHGKSVFADQYLEEVGKKNKLGHLYINEMTEDARVARLISRHTGIPYQQITSNKLTLAEKERVLAAAQTIRFGITEVHGWSVNDICHHIQQHRWDTCVVDLLHEIHYENENDLRQIISTLNRTAKQTKCAILACGHLSEHRAHSRAALPPPVLADIRGSGMIKNSADFVIACFIEAGDEEGTTFHPEGDGRISILKGRNTGTEKFPARLSPGRFRWEPIDHDREREKSLLNIGEVGSDEAPDVEADDGGAAW